jgi:hypothetical protein
MQQSHDLRKARRGNVPQLSDLAVVGDRACSDQRIKLVCQCQKPRDARWVALRLGSWLGQKSSRCSRPPERDRKFNLHLLASPPLRCSETAPVAPS